MLDSQSYYLIGLSILGIISLCILICYAVWTIKVVKHLKQSIIMYKTNKRSDFRDIREQNRILYNWETHIVKDILLLFICFAEICEPIIAIITGLIFTYKNAPDAKRPYYPHFNTTASLTPCTLKQTIFEINTQATVITFSEGWYIYFISFLVSLCAIFQILLSFLTQYLSKRYLLHPIRKTLIVHIALAFIQTIIILSLTNSYTIILHNFIIPILVFMDWCILARNSRILFRVLRSNVRDLKLNLSNRYLYIAQWKLLQVYKMLIPILLTAILFIVFAISIRFYFHLTSAFIWSHCVNQITGDAQTLNDYSKPFHILNIMFAMYQYSTFAFVILHFLLLGFPICAISFRMCYSACVKRCVEKEKDYRFNYYNFKEELLKKNLRPPY